MRRVALISSAENLANADRYREISQRLAFPQGLSDADARRLARTGKAIVHIDGGVHASEVACAQHTIQLAYDLLASADEDRTRAILDNVVLMLWPTANPDGQNMIAKWYMANVGTPYEVAGMPWLYQKYVGHDNNRDAYMLNMIESRCIARTWRTWEPQIVYTHHQTSPFPTRIWLPPFSEPIGRQTHPLMTRTVNTIGMLIAQALDEKSQAGATHKGSAFDAWYPGYVDYLPNLRNAAAFWTETALYRYATPRFYSIRDFPRDSRDLRTGSLYASPWKGGWWRLRDAVDYMLTASVAVLEFASKYKENLLYNRYQAGRDTRARYQSAPPFAWFVPADQDDPVAPVELLRRLAFNGVAVNRLTRDVDYEGVPLAAGTWVIPMDQPMAELARMVLEIQEYPDIRSAPDGPVERPYDAAAWTLPFAMGVRVLAASAPLSPEVRGAMEPVRGTPVSWREALENPSVDASPFDSVGSPGFDTDPVAAGIVPPAGRVTGSGVALAVDAAQNNAFRAVNRAWRAGGTVRFAPAADGRGARYLIGDLDDSVLGDLVTSLRLRAERGPWAGHALPRPRIGLYRPWSPSMDEGWTRWVLERFDFEARSVRNGDISMGELRARYDVIILPDVGSGTILRGFAKGTVPERYAGGIGAEGVRALDMFVRDGGTLVCLNGSSRFAISQLHLPVTDITEKLARKDFFVGGSILEVHADNTHPVMAGASSRIKVFHDGSPVFTTGDGFRGMALAKYAEKGSPLLSGYIFGEEKLRGFAAALDVLHGEGRVVLIGFRPQWRGQTFGTFRVLFNAALFSGAHAAAARGTDGFWQAPQLESKDAEKK